MRVLVLYESRGGFTLTAAREIRTGLRERGVRATIAPIRTVDAGTVAAADALVVGAWVEGKILVGVRPADAAIRAIRTLPPLEGKPAAVFCTFSASPRRSVDALADEVARAGATLVGGHAFKHRHVVRTAKNLEEVPGFVEGILGAFAKADAGSAA